MFLKDKNVKLIRMEIFFQLRLDIIQRKITINIVYLDVKEIARFSITFTYLFITSISKLRFTFKFDNLKNRPSKFHS